MKVTLQRLGGRSGTTTFHPNRTEHRAPAIAESYIADNGDVIHILTNGNELSENNYLKHWGKPKTAIIPLKANYKGKHMDGRTNWIK
jgi:hypothetical protein